MPICAFVLFKTSHESWKDQISTQDSCYFYVFFLFFSFFYQEKKEGKGKRRRTGKKLKRKWKCMCKVEGSNIILVILVIDIGFCVSEINHTRLLTLISQKNWYLVAHTSPCSPVFKKLLDENLFFWDKHHLWMIHWPPRNQLKNSYWLPTHSTKLKLVLKWV